MKLPPVRLERSSDIYKICKETEPTPDSLRRMCKIARFLLQPRVGYTDGAESAVADCVESGQPLLVAINHPSKIVDPLIVGGAALDTPLEARLDMTHTLGKDPIFRLFPEWMVGMGGIPVFRSLDHGPASVAAVRGLMDLCQYRLSEDRAMVVFPGGRHHDGDPTRVEELQPGLQLMARRALAGGVHPSILPVALYKGPNNHARSARFVVGMPLSVADLPRKSGVFLGEVQGAMQETLDHAVKIY